MNNTTKELSAQFFLSNLSHNLRNPLQGIVGYSQLLQQSKLDNNQKTYLNSISSCCLQLISLVNDILDFSKLSSGKIHINNECFSIKEIVDSVSSAISQKIKEKSQKLKFVIDKNLPECIISDSQKIIQILINLVSNANKFTEKEGRIIVSVDQVNYGVLEFRVEDNGMGISSEDQDKLFNPFFQVQESLIKDGSGLGLVICKKLVELLGGEIKVQSEKDKGSVFIFTIKYESYEDYKKYIDNNAVILKGKHILVVDTDVDTRVSIGDILFECDIIPVICSSSKEAIKIINKKRYPLSACLISIANTDTPGTILARQIKSVEGVDLPLLALSSTDIVFNSTDFDQTIPKPVNKIKLIDTLFRIINKNDVSCFQLNETLPLSPVNQLRSLSPISTASRSRSYSDPAEIHVGVRILVAEDVSYNLDMIVKMLNSMNYKNIDTATDGKIALEKLNSSIYDILLLDLKMPIVDGLGIAKHVKETLKNKPKIAVLTGSILENDREKCKELDIKYFLLKPINMSHLKSIMNKLINGSGPVKPKVL